VLGESDREVSKEEFERNTLYRDRTVLFGDGAGAFVLSGEQGGDTGIMDIRVHTDGEYTEAMWVEGGGSAFRPYFDPAMSESGEIVPVVHGREDFKMAVTVMPESVQEILSGNDLALDDLDLLVMHQANLRINEAVQKRLGLPDDKVYNNIQKYGNTTAATLPIAFHEAKDALDLSRGALVCFVALGSGLNWGSALYRCS